MSFGELLFLLILALLVFGPRKLPEIARTVAKIMTDLRRASNEFRNTLEDEIRKIEISEHEAPAPPVAPLRVVGAVAREPEQLPAAASPADTEPEAAALPRP